MPDHLEPPSRKCTNCHEVIGTDAYCWACYDEQGQSEFWSANNPLFVVLRITVVMGFLTLILWVNAEKFDANERRIILGMFVVVALGESAWAGVKKLLGK